MSAKSRTRIQRIDGARAWIRFSSVSCHIPMTVLGVSYTRKTTRDLDRTHGIMQVLGSNFRVGLRREDADPRRESTLDAR